jgi:hypothetical protein
MGTINELNTTDTLAGDDKLVIWKDQAGATRAITAEDAAAYFNGTPGGPFQPLDELLTAIAGLGPSTAAGDFIELAAQDTVRVRKLSVATYAALTVIPASFRFDDMLVYVASRATDGDGGEGYWRFDAASSATANGGTILAPDAGSGRWLRQGISTIVDVLWFGVIPDGSTNNSVAVQAAVTYALTTGRSVVLFPPKVTKLTGDVITATLSGQSGIAFVGAGMGVTQILIDNASGNGFSITCGDGNWWLNVSPSNSVQFRDMSIATNKQNLGTGIFIDGGSVEGRPGPPMLIQNVEIRGDNQFEDCFAKGVDLLDVTNINCSNVHVLIGGPGNLVGTGIDVRATDATTDPVQITFDHCKFTYGNIGLNIGSDVEGVYLTQCDFINNNIGVDWNATAESGIHVVGGHYNNYTAGVRLVGVFDGSVTGALFYRNGSVAYNGIVITGGGSITVTGNQFRGAASGTEAGIAVTNQPDEATHGVIISGNHFSNLVNGINTNNTTRKLYVGPNGYYNVTSKISGSPITVYNFQKTYSVTTVITLAGGAQSENIDVALPAGHFDAKPSAGSCMAAGSSQISGFYDYDSANSTATNARFIVGTQNGSSNIGAGNYRFSVIMSE